MRCAISPAKRIAGAIFRIIRAGLQNLLLVERMRVGLLAGQKGRAHQYAGSPQAHGRPDILAGRNPACRQYGTTLRTVQNRG